MIVCSVLAHPSEKQCAALSTQHGAMREPPQRKPRFLKIEATHGCDSMGVKEPPTILYLLRSDFSPHVSSAGTNRKSQWMLITDITKCHCEEYLRRQKYLYPQLGEVWLLSRKLEVWLLMVNLYGNTNRYHEKRPNQNISMIFKSLVSVLHLGILQYAFLIPVCFRT